MVLMVLAVLKVLVLKALSRMLKYEGHDDFRSRFKTGSCGRSIDAVIVGALGSCAGLQRAHADQVVRRRGEEKLPIYASAPAVTELAQLQILRTTSSLRRQ
jgi:hypothetical protein